MYLNALNAPSCFRKGIPYWTISRYSYVYVFHLIYLIKYLGKKKKSPSLLFYPAPSFPQTHKTSTSKQELPLPPAASSRSRPSVKLESSDGEEWIDKDKEEKAKTERMKTPSGWKCAPCHARYTDREDYITHMAEQHGKVIWLNSFCFQMRL